MLQHNDIDIKLRARDLNKIFIFFFFYPAFTTLYKIEPPHSKGFQITHKDAPQSVGLLWTSDQPVADTFT
jgi:hypothetical protein